MNELLAKTAARYVKPKFTDVTAGDTVRVYTRIKEGDKERTQYFEGVVIKRHGGIGPNATFTVRRGTGIGVERTFPLHSPVIERIEVQRGAKVRRAQLHYLRGRTGKAARLVERPVKQADRDHDHPWPERYGVVAKEIKAVEEVASKDQMNEEAEEAQAAQAEVADQQPESAVDQATDTSEAGEAKDDTAKSEKSDKKDEKAEKADAKSKQTDDNADQKGKNDESTGSDAK